MKGSFYHKVVLKRFAGLFGAGIIIVSSISMASEIGKNCFLGSIKPNLAGNLVKSSKGKLSFAEFYIPAYCYRKNVESESLYCSLEFDCVYGYVDPDPHNFKTQRLGVIQNLSHKNLTKNDDWRIDKFYNYNLPPAWNPSIPIAYRRLVI